jgi:DNA polymerase III subunit delta'
VPSSDPQTGSTVPLIGHSRLRAVLGASVDGGRLPAALLLHGHAGVGKQRLALDLARRLLCTAPSGQPCEKCQSCRFAAGLVHPDLHWVFPRPRLKDADASPADVMRDLAEAIAERVADGLLYAPPSGSEGIYVATVRALVRAASMSPAIARRKVLVVGDAEHMVPQEGADMAANAFLKLLEEPPDDTTIVLTSSEPAALLPTIRSRVIAVRVPPLADEDVRTFVRHPRVAQWFTSHGVTANERDLIARASGAPGALLAGAPAADAAEAARALLSADAQPDVYRLALKQGSAGARGAFADTLDAMIALLHERAREAARTSDERAARAAAEGVRAVQEAKIQANGNVNPQLITASLLRTLAGAQR